MKEKLEDLQETLRQINLEREVYLKPWATKTKDAIRLIPMQEDFRPSFSHDVDRIIHELSYTRYQNKTQVFSAKENDHISHRMTHVQLVSKIARTIGRSLSLNEDLIEAIALGHDIGHTPLGHSGEAMLDKISKKELGVTFAHNVESVRYYMEIAKQGKGLNLCVQTLDGILTHNGEMLEPIYQKEEKTKEDFLRQYKEGMKDAKQIKKYHPMTLEGCVVRISDIIGYIGRDIEDAIEIGKLKRDEIPSSITNVLGNTNQQIVNTLICDIIKESFEKPYIAMSKEVYEALFALKEFNMKYIYSKSLTKEEYNRYERGMQRLYEMYLKDVQSENKESVIYTLFLDEQDKEYLEKTSKERQVIDFIAGMTDDFFIRQIKSLK